MYKLERYINNNNLLEVKDWSIYIYIMQKVLLLASSCQQIWWRKHQHKIIPNRFLNAHWTNIGKFAGIDKTWMDIAFHSASFDLLFLYQAFSEFVHFCSSTSEPIKTQMETASSLQSFNSSHFHIQQNSSTELTPSPTRSDDWEEKMDDTFEEATQKKTKTQSSYSMQPLLNVTSIENI